MIYISPEYLEHLIELTKEPSHTMPRGLTRQQKRAWIKSNKDTNMMYMLIAESQLHWDDSEYRKENLGLFNPYDKEKVIELINNYWTYNGEDVMTAEVANGVIDLHDNGEDYFQLLEYESVMEFESTRKEYKFSIEGHSV